MATKGSTLIGCFIQKREWAKDSFKKWASCKRGDGLNGFRKSNVKSGLDSK